MEILKGQKVLLIAPLYHNYIFKIANEFKRLGAYIEYYSEEPTSILFSNFYLSRLKKYSLFNKVYELEVAHINCNILRAVKKKNFDHVVVIKGDLIKEEILLQFRKLLPSANFVLYQWDSINYYNYLSRVKYFDKVFSFDYLDCYNHSDIHYLPLFFMKEYGKIAQIKGDNCIYDLFFLGYNHTIRVQKLIEMIDFCESNNLKYSFNLKTTISEKIKLRELSQKVNCFFDNLKYEDFSEIYIKSKAILDISPPHQSGLSIRLIEAVGANKKIITTNKFIINEQFYDPDMIFIWEDFNLTNLVAFLERKHKNYNADEYSIESFVLNLINIKNFKKNSILLKGQ